MKVREWTHDKRGEKGGKAHGELDAGGKKRKSKRKLKMGIGRKGELRRKRSKNVNEELAKS